VNPALPVPCLHRIHVGEPQGSFRIHQAIGVSIELSELVCRLGALEQRAALLGLPPRSVHVTFDDGWQDPVVLEPHFEGWGHLQPVLFLTQGQLKGDCRLLPLPRLYEWCGREGVTLEEMKAKGLTRKKMKSMPEDEQHAWLDELGVTIDGESTEVLGVDEVRSLMEVGWLVGSHGHDHHDLRMDEPPVLRQGLGAALAEVVAFGGRPWLAWPEGRCTQEGCELAKEVGFTSQLSLGVESGAIVRSDLVHREIWR
jgi:hypothetical protein